MADSAIAMLDSITSRFITGRQTTSARRAGGTGASEDPQPTQRRNLVNLDGESFDLGAPRGTYVDVFA